MRLPCLAPHTPSTRSRAARGNGSGALRHFQQCAPAPGASTYTRYLSSAVLIFNPNPARTHTEMCSLSHLSLSQDVRKLGFRDISLNNEIRQFASKVLTRKPRPSSHSLTMKELHHEAASSQHSTFMAGSMTERDLLRLHRRATHLISSAASSTAAASWWTRS